MLRGQLRPAVVLTVLLCLLTGAIYPGLVTAVAQLAFPAQANGSLIVRGDTVVGSALIGQSFIAERYFHSRPSAAGAGYDAMASGGSNKGPTDSTLLAAVTARVEAAVADGAIRGQVPADLVTASGSGLDPHLSPASVALQVARVARVRGASPAAVQSLVTRFTEPRQFGILGEPRVNVLRLNLAVDSAFPLQAGAGR